VGARLGKSGGSLIQQGLLVVFGTISAMTPYLAIILGAIVLAWIIAAKALNKQFLTLTSSKEKSIEVNEVAKATS
jgi:AAA family ATP:ADP antiporter